MQNNGLICEKCLCIIKINNTLNIMLLKWIGEQAGFKEVLSFSGTVQRRSLVFLSLLLNTEFHCCWNCNASSVQLTFPGENHKIHTMWNERHFIENIFITVNHPFIDQ